MKQNYWNLIRHFYAVSAILLAAFFNVLFLAVGLGAVYVLDLLFEIKAVREKRKKKIKQKVKEVVVEPVKISPEILNKMSFDEALTVVDLFEPDYEFERETTYQSALPLLLNERRNATSSQKNALKTIEVSAEDLIKSAPRTPYGGTGDLLQGIQKTQEGNASDMLKSLQKTQEGNASDLLKGLQKTQEGNASDLLKGLQKTQEGNVEKRSYSLIKSNASNTTTEDWNEAIMLLRIKESNLYDGNKAFEEHEKTPVFPINSIEQE